MKLTNHKVVSRAQWVEERKALLAREKELTRQHDALAEQRRALPWVKVDKTYVFDTPAGKKTLAELFDGRRQLVIYHFMFGPDWKEGCPSCSYVCDHLDGAVPHLAARNVTLTMVSRAPLAKIEAFKKRMGWRFPWVSSNGTDFNHDFRVSFTKEEKARGKVDYNYKLEEFPSLEAPGLSVFYQDDNGDIFHTYSTYGRGLDQFVGTYTILDQVPKGRDEEELAFSMAWVRHHDRYGTNTFLDTDKPYWPDVATPEAVAAAGAASRSHSCGCGSATECKS